jgi:hypothetical protein
MNAAVAACSMKMLPKRFINLHNYFNPLSSLSLKKQIKQVAVSDPYTLHNVFDGVWTFDDGALSHRFSGFEFHPI